MTKTSMMRETRIGEPRRNTYGRELCVERSEPYSMSPTSARNPNDTKSITSIEAVRNLGCKESFESSLTYIICKRNVKHERKKERALEIVKARTVHWLEARFFSYSRAYLAEHQGERDALDTA